MLRAKVVPRRHSAVGSRPGCDERVGSIHAGRDRILHHGGGTIGSGKRGRARRAIATLVRNGVRAIAARIRRCSFAASKGGAAARGRVSSLRQDRPEKLRVLAIEGLVEDRLPSGAKFLQYAVASFVFRHRASFEAMWTPISRNANSATRVAASWNSPVPRTPCRSQIPIRPSRMSARASAAGRGLSPVSFLSG